MSDPHHRLHELLRQNLAEVNLTQIAETYGDVLEQAARKNSSLLEAFSALIAGEIAARRQRALQRRIKQAKLPKPKTLADYDFDFPKRIPEQKVPRLFDGDSSPCDSRE